MEKLFKILNQPFILMLVPALIIGFVSWKYTEIQKNTTEAKLEDRALRKANLELTYLLKDIRAAGEIREKLNTGILNNVFKRLQFNGMSSTDPEVTYYAPYLQNTMMEIDLRTESEGINKFKHLIFQHQFYLGKMGQRLAREHMDITSNQHNLIWTILNSEEKKQLSSLAKLTHDIEKYYESSRRLHEENVNWFYNN